MGGRWGRGLRLYPRSGPGSTISIAWREPGFPFGENVPSSSQSDFSPTVHRESRWITCRNSQHNMDLQGMTANTVTWN